MPYTSGQDITVGDIVRNVKGKVEYTVREVGTETITVESNNTGRRSETPREKLVLIEAARVIPDVIRDPIMPVRESMFSAEEEAAIMRDVDVTDPEPEITEENTSYQKAILSALNRLGKHVYGGTVTSKRNQRKVAKQARRNARRAKNARFLEISTAE